MSHERNLEEKKRREEVIIGIVLTVEPVAISKVWYLKIFPSSLTSVFEARSALTISVLRIRSIPVKIKYLIITPQALLLKSPTYCGINFLEKT